jgi:hypothetical protein
MSDTRARSAILMPLGMYLTFDNLRSHDFHNVANFLA